MLNLSDIYSANGPCLVISTGSVYFLIGSSLSNNMFIGMLATLNVDGSYSLGSAQTLYSGTPVIWAVVPG
jgi:hypothetical protein